MSTPEKLRFRARGTALVPNLDRITQPPTFVGRVYKEVSPGKWGFAPVDEDTEVPYRAEYVKACADGDLYPADEETAAACAPWAKSHGQPAPIFDKTFGAKALEKPAVKTADKAAANAAEKG